MHCGMFAVDKPSFLHISDTWDNLCDKRMQTTVVNHQTDCSSENLMIEPLQAGYEIFLKGAPADTADSRLTPVRLFLSLEMGLPFWDSEKQAGLKASIEISCHFGRSKTPKISPSQSRLGRTSGRRRLGSLVLPKNHGSTPLMMIVLVRKRMIKHD